MAPSRAPPGNPDPSAWEASASDTSMEDIHDAPTRIEVDDSMIVSIAYVPPYVVSILVHILQINYRAILHKYTSSLHDSLCAITSIPSLAFYAKPAPRNRLHACILSTPLT